MKTSAFSLDDGVNGAGRRDSYSIHVIQTDEQSFVGRCSNKTGKSAADFKDLAFLYPLVEFEATISCSPQVVRGAAYDGAVANAKSFYYLSRSL